MEQTEIREVRASVIKNITKGVYDISELDLPLVFEQLSWNNLAVASMSAAWDSYRGQYFVKCIHEFTAQNYRAEKHHP